MLRIGQKHLEASWALLFAGWKGVYLQYDGTVTGIDCTSLRRCLLCVGRIRLSVCVYTCEVALFEVSRLGHNQSENEKLAFSQVLQGHRPLHSNRLVWVYQVDMSFCAVGLTVGRIGSSCPDSRRSTLNHVHLTWRLASSIARSINILRHTMRVQPAH